MKKVSLLLILAFSVLTVSAQEVEAGKSSKPGRSTTFVQNGFWDNWFIGAGAGANIYFDKGNGSAGFFKRPTVSGNFQVGKWINPYMGLRAKATVGKIHNFSNGATTMHSQLAATGEIDFMVDVINYLGKYSESRVYSLIPYVGIGGAYGRSYTRANTGKPRHHEKSLTFNGGLINSFRVSKRLAIELELSAVVLKDNFNREERGRRSYDLLTNTSVNLVYKLGKTHNFTEAVLLDQGLIDDLNGKINALKLENDELSKRPKFCPECPEAPAPKVVEVIKPSLGANAVYFRIGSANVDRSQEANIYNVAKYLEENPNVKITVVGYADKETGSASFNEKLSQKRAQKVSDALVKKYNINSNRINIEWRGDKAQPYSSRNAWNRVVIFKSAE